ncbi:hypothetical protein V8B97DRAFT_1956515 [Scleroderma yunnanense]
MLAFSFFTHTCSLTFSIFHKLLACKSSTLSYIQCLVSVLFQNLVCHTIYAMQHLNLTSLDCEAYFISFELCSCFVT